MPKQKTETSIKMEKLREAALPLIKHLSDNYHPHITAIVTPTSVELSEGIMNIAKARLSEMKQIRKIVEAHFSITPEERKEAVGMTKNWLKHNKDTVFLKKKSERVFKTILKALGENNG